jgi:hypothetical protein
MSRCGLTLALLCASLAACGGASSGKAGISARTAVAATAHLAGCPVTIPNGRKPPGEPQSREDHGNGALWTALAPDGQIVATREFVRPDGSMRIKFPWWGSGRAGTDLSITGSSIDPRGGFAHATISPGLTGAPHFWASGIVFPVEGCWRITGTAGGASLTFVCSL